MAALLRREILIATRAGGGAFLGLVFFLIIVLLAALGLGRDTELLARAAPGTIWSAALLASLLSLDRLFQADFEDGSLEGLALAPAPLEMVVVVKSLAHWLTTGLPLVVASPVMGLMLQLPQSGYPWLLASLLVGTLSLSCIGAIGAALTLGVRRGGLLLSLLVMPLFIPTLIFGVRAVQEAAAGRDPWPAMMLLLGISLFSFVLSPLASAKALRINMA